MTSSPPTSPTSPASPAPEAGAVRTDKPRRAARVAITLALLAAALLCACAVRLCVGERFGYPGGQALASLARPFLADLPWFDAGPKSVLDVRGFRVVLAVLAGAALATSGVALQSLLRNSLAEPFILGLSSGAAVGVLLQKFVSVQQGAHLGPLQWGALAGVSVSMGIVYLAGRKRGVIDPLGLLLTGVVLSAVNGALIMLLFYLFDTAGLTSNLTHWMMGYLNEGVGPATVRVCAVVILGSLALLVAKGPAMDVASFSDAEAVSMGVNLRVLRRLLFVTSSVTAAAAVVLAGPIGFVGLICPHLVRMMIGPSHRALLIGSALCGATLIVLADTAVVAANVGQGLMPIGIFTAMLGGPFFLWMLRPRLGRGLTEF